MPTETYHEKKSLFIFEEYEDSEQKV